MKRSRPRARRRGAAQSLSRGGALFLILCGALLLLGSGAFELDAGGPQGSPQESGEHEDEAHTRPPAHALAAARDAAVRARRALEAEDYSAARRHIEEVESSLGKALGSGNVSHKVVLTQQGQPL